MTFDFNKELGDLDLSGLGEEPKPLDTEPDSSAVMNEKLKEAAEQAIPRVEEETEQQMVMRWVSKLSSLIPGQCQQANMEPTAAILTMIDEESGKRFTVCVNLSAPERIGWLEIIKNDQF